MSEPKFAQPERRNLLTPILAALIVLGIAIALLLQFTPHKVAKLSLPKTAVYPTHTVYKAESLLVGRDRSEDNLYIVTTLHVEDGLHLPLFIKDFTGSLVTADGEKIESSAVQKPDLENLYTTFPALRPFASAPLERETRVDPGQAVEGMVLLRFPVSEDAWNHRASAKLNVDFYHQGPISIDIPNGEKIAPQSKETGKP